MLLRILTPPQGSVELPVCSMFGNFRPHAPEYVAVRDANGGTQFPGFLATRNIASR